MTQMIQAWVGDAETLVEKLEVHQRGLKHKAVSVFLFDGDRVLLQQRALSKYHTPGLWANTCCTHPMPDEIAMDCAHRRLADELNITDVSLTFADTVEYKADVGNGLIEHEVVDIFCGHLASDLEISPNPEEVADVAWMALDDLRQAVLDNPQKFTPWLRIYLEHHSEKILGFLDAG